MTTSSSVVFAAASLLTLLAEFSSNCQVLATAFGGIGGDFGFHNTRSAFLKRSQRNSMLYQQVQFPQPYYTSPYMDQSAVLSQSQPAAENAAQTENQSKIESNSIPKKVPAFDIADEFALSSPFGSYKRANLRRLASQSARGFGRK